MDKQLKNKKDKGTTTQNKAKTTESKKQENTSFWKKLGEMVRKAVDCCIE